MNIKKFNYKTIYSFINKSVLGVLLGESTHGTKEFYDIRKNITKYLITNKNFRCIFLEMEWSLGVRMNKFIHTENTMKSKVFLDKLITKYPIWMTNNYSISKLLDFLKQWNTINTDDKVYIYGIDCQDIELAKKDICDDETIHCKIVKEIIDNYQIMINPSKSYWNERDKMWNKIIKYVNCNKFILWAHNSHIGDARAYKIKNNLNIGELLKKLLGKKIINIGFTTSNGYVRASHRWGGKDYNQKMNRPITNSYEKDFDLICNNNSINSFIYISRKNIKKKYKYLRYIGVSYIKGNEKKSHYKLTNIDQEFDYIIHVNNSSSVEIKIV